MLKLLRRARGRLLGNRLLSEGAAALSAALGVFILLLLAGADSLDWRWLILPPLAIACWGAWRTFRRRPSLYAVAQLVDRRLGLEDTLSTAVFFGRAEPAAGSPEVRRSVLRAADRLAQSADVRKAVPYRAPRAVYVAAALLLVASGLFALRYAVLLRLDLKPSLASILPLRLQFQTRAETARNELRNRRPGIDNGEPPDALPRDLDSSPDGEPAADGNAREAADAPEAGESQAKADGASANQGKESPSEARPKGESRKDSGAERAAESAGADSAGQDQPAEAAQQNAADNSRSLLDKLKDAVQSLLARVKPPPGSPGDSQRQASAQSGERERENGGAQQSSGEQGTEGASQGEPQSAAEAARGDAGVAQGPARKDSQPAGKQAGSGIGSEDGDKAVRRAEQLAAMGKISEIFGRRAADISGEATVETQSSAQQLRTPYAPRAAAPAESGSAIGRDEVPLDLQPYVTRYFEQVRKSKK